MKKILGQDSPHITGIEKITLYVLGEGRVRFFQSIHWTFGDKVNLRPAGMKGRGIIYFDMLAYHN